MSDQSSLNSASLHDKNALLADRNDVRRINDESYDNKNTFDGSLLESAVEMANIDGQQRNSAYLINDRVDKDVSSFAGNSNFIIMYFSFC